MRYPNLAPLVADFLKVYDAEAKDRIWQDQSRRFRAFWNDTVLAAGRGPISDDECDEVIRILDRNGKGNTRNSEAVARAMVAQGAWRRMLNEFHSDAVLGSSMNRALCEQDPVRKVAAIDEIYAINEGRRNNLTGPSGNAISAFLAAWDPVNNLSVISLKDRRSLMEFLGIPMPISWETSSVGELIVSTNYHLLGGLRELGVAGSARTASVFCYVPAVKLLWKGEHTVKREDKSVSVTVPEPVDDENDSSGESGECGRDEIRESMQIQALLARIGTAMGFSVWLPKPDRGRVLKLWTPEGNLLDELPLSYDSTTLKTIELIDVLWLKRRFIVRAFEVEHTTSVYSGLLRMADLVALQPNININLHIVAPEAKRDKVKQELQRPVFQLLQGRPLPEICTYLSYASIREIADSKHLAYLSHEVIEDYEEKTE